MTSSLVASSKAAAFLNRLPFTAPRSVPPITAIGVASTSASGQAMMKIVIISVIANSRDCPIHQNQTTVAQHCRHWWRQIEQRPDGSRSPRSRPHLQPMTEQDEDEKHRRCFIELVAFEEKGGANAEDVACPDAEEDQHRHVENSVPKCPDGSDDERPGGIEDRSEERRVGREWRWRWWRADASRGS